MKVFPHALLLLLCLIFACLYHSGAGTGLVRPVTWMNYGCAPQWKSTLLMLLKIVMELSRPSQPLPLPLVSVQ